MEAQEQKKKVKYRVDRIVICALVFLLAVSAIVFLIVRLVKNGGQEEETPNAGQTVDISDLIHDGEYIEITMEDCSMYIGTTVTLTCIAEPEEYQDLIVWNSTDPEVVSVDEDGTVTVLSRGTAVITAVAGVLSDSLIIQGIDPEETEDVQELPVYEATEGETAVSSSGQTGESGQQTSGTDSKGETQTAEPTKQESSNTTAAQQNDSTRAEGETAQQEETKTVKEQTCETLTELGFSRYISDTFIYREDGNYLGEVIVEEELIQIYLMTRTSAFDQALKDLLKTFLPENYETAYANMIGADTTQTLRIDGRKIRIIPATDSQNSHIQMIIYY